MPMVSTSDFGRLIVKACSTVNATHGADGKLGLLHTEMLRYGLRYGTVRTAWTPESETVFVSAGCWKLFAIQWFRNVFGRKLAGWIPHTRKSTADSFDWNSKQMSDCIFSQLSKNAPDDDEVEPGKQVTVSSPLKSLLIFEHNLETEFPGSTVAIAMWRLCEC